MLSFANLILVLTSVVPVTAMSRLLEDGEYMQDNQGNRYATYSLSWRFLGMFIDCDLEVSNARRRQLEENECTRKVMWAAVRIY